MENKKNFQNIWVGSDLSAKIRKYLGQNSEIDPSLEEDIKIIDSIINSSIPLEKGRILFRGMKFIPEDLPEYKPGDIIKVNSYESFSSCSSHSINYTSKNEDYYQSVLLVTYFPKNSKLYNIEIDVANYVNDDYYFQEYEYITPRNSEYLIKDVKDIDLDNGFLFEKKFRIVFCTCINQQGSGLKLRKISRKEIDKILKELYLPQKKDNKNYYYPFKDFKSFELKFDKSQRDISKIEEFINELPFLDYLRTQEFEMITYNTIFENCYQYFDKENNPIYNKIIVKIPIGIKFKRNILKEIKYTVKVKINGLGDPYYLVILRKRIK